MIIHTSFSYWSQVIVSELKKIHNYKVQYSSSYERASIPWLFNSLQSPILISLHTFSILSIYIFLNNILGYFWSLEHLEIQNDYIKNWTGHCSRHLHLCQMISMISFPYNLTCSHNLCYAFSFLILFQLNQISQPQGQFWIDDAMLTVAWLGL